MKKILSIIGLLIIYDASAQQNEFYDIQKHLAKKNKKRISQIQTQKPSNLLLTIKELTNRFPPMDQAILSHDLPDNNKVFILPLDNMNCIVPDMSQFNMLNAGFSEKFLESLSLIFNEPGKIPNLQKPYKVIPDFRNN